MEKLTLDEHIKVYNELKKYKDIIGNIDKDYFFYLVDLLLKNKEA